MTLTEQRSRGHRGGAAGAVARARHVAREPAADRRWRGRHGGLRRGRDPDPAGRGPRAGRRHGPARGDRYPHPGAADARRAGAGRGLGPAPVRPARRGRHHVRRLGRAAGVVASDEPDAWDPMDMLVAPLYDGHGVLRGTLAIDEPLDGRRPDLERRRVLEKFAVLAARAVLASVERESLAEQVAMADTVKAIVRTSSAQLSLGGLLEASEQTLLEGFAAQRCGSRPSRTTTSRRPTTCPTTSPSPSRPTSWRSRRARPPTAGATRSS